MITILGKGLISWTGIFAGLFFILAFIGCRCNVRLNGLHWFRKNHSNIMKIAFFIFLAHASLAILSSWFGIWI